MKKLILVLTFAVAGLLAPTSLAVENPAAAILKPVKIVIGGVGNIVLGNIGGAVAGVSQGVIEGVADGTVVSKPTVFWGSLSRWFRGCYSASGCMW